VSLIDDDAMVLDSQRYRDRHLLVTLLTGRVGMVRGVLRRARGGKAPQAAAAQVLSLVHVTGAISRRAELATFLQFDLVTSSYPLAKDLERSTAAAVVAELLATFCPLEEPAPRRFRLGVSLLRGLLSGCDPDTAVAYAQFWMLALGGVLPTPDEPGWGERESEFLASCRQSNVTELPTRVPEQVAIWLDRRVRSEAERPLRALDFFRSLDG
jgi:DNA repair protein RecO (recombination protein O)